MNILVTGASGFLGRYIVNQAIRSGHQVRAQIRPASNVTALNWAEHEQVQIVKADLRSAVDLEQMVAGVDVVIHAAADKTGGFYDQFAANVVGTENLLAAMAKANVTDMVLISSFSVYDYLSIPEGAVLDEDSPLDEHPQERDDYAQTKLLQEKMVRDYAEAKQMHAVVLRPGVIYGRDNLWFALIGIELGAGRWLRIGSSPCLPVSYVENCAQAVVLAAEKTGALGGRVINVIDDDLPSRRSYLRQLKRALNIKLKVLPMPWFMMRLLAWIAQLANRLLFRRQARLPGILRPAALHARFKAHRYPNDRLHEQLGWTQRYGLTEALKRSTSPTEPSSETSHTDAGPAGSDDQDCESSCALPT
jgi:nucleoside-diphosphate-sugar epimerase